MNEGETRYMIDQMRLAIKFNLLELALGFFLNYHNWHIGEKR